MTKNKNILKTFFIDWFVNNGRIFPWRKPGTTPFAFLITEMLLRQTRAANVAKIWENFTQKYTSPKEMLNADRASLVNQLKELGFGNQKAEALQHASKWLLDHNKGSVPSSLNNLLLIPHIGLYSARAILCFAFGQRIEIVDTNVQRFYSRYYGLKIKADIRRNPDIWSIAKQNLPREKSKAIAHNYGLLDFTAEICKSGRPRCEICPLSSRCTWGKNQVILNNSV